MISEVRQIQKASKPVWKVHARLDFWFPAAARGDREETGEDREEEGGPLCACCTISSSSDPTSLSVESAGAHCVRFQSFLPPPH